ncbi:hypothetical protein CASFOL_029970 [Castilleja foliolosa]|uniref:RxLR effector protein n=1 Tax=Castilleja foliolosa TaxID=1961234 RepID=A0ABD3C9F4_9LAMI
MSTTYFFTFLLALVAISAATTTARQSSGARLDNPRSQIPSTTRFHSGKIKTHQSKSIEKSPDDMADQRAKLKHAGARRTMEKELGKTLDQDRTAADSLLAGGAVDKNLENVNGRRALPGARPEYVGQKMDKVEWEEWTTRKPAGFRGKTIDHIRKYDDNMH